MLDVFEASVEVLDDEADDGVCEADEDDSLELELDLMLVEVFGQVDPEQTV